MAVPVKLGSQLEVGVPVSLFRAEPEIENYDVAGDGSLFLATTALENVRESPLHVIFNWTSLVRER